MGNGPVDWSDLRSHRGSENGARGDGDGETDDEGRSGDGGDRGRGDAMIPGQAQHSSAISNILPSPIGRLFS